MCRPLTRRGDHAATTKERERPPPPGGPAGAMRRNARAKEPPQRRPAGMIDAARWRKARATAGCAQAPDLKPQAGPRSSTARHGRAASRDEARRFYFHRTKTVCLLIEVKDDQRISFHAGLRLLSASRQRHTHPDYRCTQWNAERLC